MIAAGHGVAAYDYGLKWFSLCLEAIESASIDGIKNAAVAVRAANMDGKDWTGWINGRP